MPLLHNSRRCLAPESAPPAGPEPRRQQQTDHVCVPTRGQSLVHPQTTRICNPHRHSRPALARAPRPGAEPCRLQLPQMHQQSSLPLSLTPANPHSSRISSHPSNQLSTTERRRREALQRAALERGTHHGFNAAAPHAHPKPARDIASCLRAPPLLTHRGVPAAPAGLGLPPGRCTDPLRDNVERTNTSRTHVQTRRVTLPCRTPRTVPRTGSHTATVLTRALDLA